MAWKAEIAGIVRTTSLSRSGGPLRIDRVINERSRTNLLINPGLLPSRFSDVVLYDQDGVTKRFGGVLLNRNIKGLAYGSNPYTVDAECSDYFTYFDWSYISLSYSSSVTLKAVLTDIIAALPASYGITLDATQATGPTLGAFSWVTKKASDAVRELSDRTGYVSRITPGKVLKMLLPGSEAAPFTLSDGSPHFREIVWKDTDQIPANKVTVICGPNGPGDAIVNQWLSTAATTYSLNGVNVPSSGVWPGIVNIGGTIVGGVVTGGVNYPIFPVGVGGTNDIEWDYTASGGTLNFKGTSSTIISPVGTRINLTYSPQYPFRVSISSGATPVIESVGVYPDILDYSQAVEFATQLLASLNQQPRQIVCTESRDAGWEPGQQLTVNLTNRSLVGTFLITRVTISLFSDTFWTYDIEAIENSVYQGSHLDEWREIAGGTSTATTGSGGVSVTTSVLTSPFPLGGSRQQSLPVGTTSTPVIDWLPFVPKEDQSAIVRCSVKSRTGGITVTPELYKWNGSSWVLHTSGSAATGTTDQDQTFAVALTANEKVRLQVKTNTAGESAYCIGQLEST